MCPTGSYLKSDQQHRPSQPHEKPYRSWRAIVALNGVLASDVSAASDTVPERWLVFGLLGSTNTPVPLATDAGAGISAQVNSPGIGFGFGLEIHFERYLALRFRPSVLLRDSPAMEWVDVKAVARAGSLGITGPVMVCRLFPGEPRFVLISFQPPAG
jgi:hypothetical protein